MNDSSSVFTEYIPLNTKFWLYITFLCPSVICSAFVLYHFSSDRILRRALNNHVIIVLLFTVIFSQATIYPWMLYYFHQTEIWERSFAFCITWAFIDWAVYMLQLLLFAWASIERHILIFHDRWVSTRRKRFMFHYLPLILILVYWLIFYGLIFFYPSCPNTLDFTSMVCFSPCILNNPLVHAFEILLNNLLPNLLIIVFSLTLLLRIVWQKHRIHQPILWRKHRKMTIQLLSISALYLLVTFPWALIVFASMCGWSSDAAGEWTYFTSFNSYFIALLLPFVSLSSLSGLRNRLRKALWCKRATRLVAPEPLGERQLKNNEDLARWWQSSFLTQNKTQ